MIMTFTWPAMLWFLLLLPLFILLYFRLQQRRRQLAARYGSLGLVQSADGRPAGFRRHIPVILFMAGLATLVLALARPQAVVSLPRIQGTVILAFDVSASMAADDIQPSRIEAARAAAQEFVNNQPVNVLVGVVAFSDSGLSVQVPTSEKEAIFAALARLAPSRGTSLANGIVASLTTIATANNPPETHYYSSITPEPTPAPTPMPAGTYTPAVIVLLTDGENTQEPDPLLAAQAAADRGVRIYTVGVGSAAGADLEIEGFIVHTQLDEAMLQQISQITGGTYYNATNEQDLRGIYDNLDLQWVIKPEKMEVTSLFAGASILILLISGTFSLLWLNRLP
jgi:Ca-activated chloride channel family protein